MGCSFHKWNPVIDSSAKPWTQVELGLSTENSAGYS